MHLLEATLALALSMLIFSTLVTILVETALRLKQSRRNGLAEMLGRLFDEVLWQDFRPGILTQYAPGMAPNQKTLRENFILGMTHRAEGTAGSQGGWRFPVPASLQAGAVSPLHITPAEFVQRLAHTDIGLAIARHDSGEGDGGPALSAVIHSITHRFSDHAASAREKFKSKASFVSIFAALAFAFAANIDAARLLTQFINDPSLVQTLLSEADNAAEKPAPHLAIGHDYFPFCATPSKDPACKDVKKWVEAFCEPYWSPKEEEKCIKANPTLRATVFEGASVGSLLVWGFWVFVTGLLIGLGGPFWFDFYTNFSRRVGLIRQLRGGTAPPKDPSATAGQKGDETAPLDIKTLTEDFRTQIAARKLMAAV